MPLEQFACITHNDQHCLFVNTSLVHGHLSTTICLLKVLHASVIVWCNRLSEAYYLLHVVGVVQEAIHIDALKCHIAQHGAHAQWCGLQDIILANFKQPPIVPQAAHRCLSKN